jgi:hypothetical protein
MKRAAESPAGAPVRARDEIPIGDYLERILQTAYRARRAVLLEGPTGVGKSELVRAMAGRMGIGLACLDLSLLEPPDLVGLPTMTSGRTIYAPPSILPLDGQGILLLEELNRAERHVQQPALQLLTARRLHEYELPPGWSCIAAVNPEDGGYHVTPLDPALRARFLCVRVRADRKTWLAWAAGTKVHPAILTVVRSHDRIFDEVPPRSWAYASDVLRALAPGDRDDETLVRDLLRGYLGPVWTDIVVSVLERYAGDLDINPLDVLASYHDDPVLQAAIRGYRDGGQTDVLSEIVHRLGGVLRSPEAAALARRGQLRLDAFEAFIVDLGGDERELLQEALGTNAPAALLLGYTREDILAARPGDALARQLRAWCDEPLRRHRALLVATLLVGSARPGVRRQVALWTADNVAVLEPLLGVRGAPIEALRRQRGVGDAGATASRVA